MIRRIASTCAIVATLWLTTTAAAQPSAPAEGSTDETEARRLFEQATSLASQDRWDQACPLFAAAHALHRSGGTSMNVARCHEESGRQREALDLYREVVALPNQPAERLAVATARVKALEEALARAATPPPISPGKEPSTPTPPPPSSDEGDDGIGYVPSAIAFGVGGAGLIVGSIFGGLALSEMSDVEEACTSGVCPTALEADRDAAQTKSWVANAGFAIGFAGVAAGVVLAVIASGSDEPAARARPIRRTARGLAVAF